MALLDQIRDRQNNAGTATGRGRATNTADLPRATVWLNVGYDANGKFVNLPLGLPIDTMEHITVRGQNEEWVQLSHARNELLKALQEAGDALEAGGEIDVPLIIRIRKVNNEMQVDSATNPFSMEQAGFKL